jgi:hypothetical protein
MNKLEKARQDSKERRAKGGAGGNFFKVEEDSEEQIRILDDMAVINTQGAYFHKTPNGFQGRKYGSWEICLDQDEDGNQTGEECPGCERNAEDPEEYRRKLVFYANVIWRNATVRKKDNKTGKWKDTDEKKDQLAVWEISQDTAQDALYDAELTYKSLTNRDYIVRRRGTGFDTTYSLSPEVDEEGETKKKPLSAADKELDEKKADLTEKVAMKSVEDWGVIKKKAEESEGSKKPDSDAGESPFLNRNKKSDDE